jgi:uncharacterized protein YukE
MYIKTDYDDLKSMGKYLVNTADDFNSTIDKMLSKLDELELYWKGPDYDNYKEVYRTYLLNIKTSYIELNAFGNALDRVSYYYGQIDSEFDDKMRKMGNEDVDRK